MWPGTAFVFSSSLVALVLTWRSMWGSAKDIVGLLRGTRKSGTERSRPAPCCSPSVRVWSSHWRLSFRPAGQDQLQRPVALGAARRRVCTGCWRNGHCARGRHGWNEPVRFSGRGQRVVARGRFDSHRSRQPNLRLPVVVQDRSGLGADPRTQIRGELMGWCWSGPSWWCPSSLISCC